MNPARLAELNDRLANPPEFNPSDSEQLGLFVVSQLAKRHGIRVTLKASPYGGTAAIALVPQHLVVTEEAFRTGLPGEPIVAQLTANGNHAPAEPDGRPVRGVPGPVVTELNGGPSELAPGVRISGPLRRSQGSIPEPAGRGAHATPPPALTPANGTNGTNGTNGAGPDDLPRRRHDPSAPPADFGPLPSRPLPSRPRPNGGVPTGGVPSGAVPYSSGAASGPPSPFDVFMPRHAAQPDPDPGPATAPGAAPLAGAGPAPAGPAGPAPYPDQPAPFPGWTVQNPPAAPGGRAAAGPGGPATPMTPVASPRPAQAPGPPWELSRETGPLPAVPTGTGTGTAGNDGGDDLKGLPRRVRQANLAPQLRDSPPPRKTTVASTGLSGGTPGPSPAEIRQTMSALQRGWQEGRSQVASPPPAPPATTGGEDPTVSEETRGD
jgi:hypothetical protein